MTTYDLTLAFTQNAAFYFVKQALGVVSERPYRKARNIFKSYVESKLDDSTLFSNVVNDTQIETELPDYIPAWMIVSSMYPIWYDILRLFQKTTYHLVLVTTQ